MNPLMTTLEPTTTTTTAGPTTTTTTMETTTTEKPNKQINVCEVVLLQQLLIF